MNPADSTNKRIAGDAWSHVVLCIARLLPSLALVVASGLVTWAGANAHAEERYRDLIFDDVDVQRAVEYGRGQVGDTIGEPLLLDVYTPAGDVRRDRPVIVLAFPGGFVDGARDDDVMVLMARRFAQHGYVAASIDYRLIEDRPRSRDDLEISIIRSVHDMLAAVRFFREDAAAENLFGTDGRNVFVGGVSAGAVMAAVAGVLDDRDRVDTDLLEYLNANGGFAGNSRPAGEVSSAVSGVLQIAGAVRDLDWIGPDSAPIYAAHEEFDPIVPCSTLPGLGFARFALTLTSSGACDMIPVARDQGVPTRFYLDQGAIAHIGFSERRFAEILDDAADFFFVEVIRPRPLVSAVLPSSRAVRPGETASVFASVVNVSAEPVSGCLVYPMTDVPIELRFQRTNSNNVPVGDVNTPFDLAPGATQTLLLEFTPSDDFSARDVFLRYECLDNLAASSVPGVNSVVLSAEDDAGADVIGLTTVVDLALEGDETALFAVGSANVGQAAAITVVLDDGGAGLPLDLSVCRTDPETGACVGNFVNSLIFDFPAGTTQSFAIAAKATGPIANDPAKHRVFVRFVDPLGRLRGATSTAIRAQ